MSSPKISYTTRCRVPGCTEATQHTPLDTPIIGQPQRQAIDFVKGLSKHIEKKHAEQHQALMQWTPAFYSLMTLSWFECPDPAVSALQEQVRSTIHRMTRRNYITDEQIQQKISEVFGLAADDPRADGMLTLLTEFRDILCEEGRHAPRSAPPLVAV